MKTKYIILCALGLGVYVFAFVNGALYIHDRLKPAPPAYTKLQPAPKLERAARSHYGNAVDTLMGRDTIYFYPDKDKEQTGRIELVIAADSLNGATNGRVWYEKSALGVAWIPSEYSWENMVINGSTQQILQVSDFLYKQRIRIKVVSPTSTQRTKIQFAYKIR